MNQNRFEIVPYRRWRHADGRTASVHGAVPWTRPADKPLWAVEQAGYTIYDNQHNTYGLGRPPFATQADAQAWLQRLESPT